MTIFKNAWIMCEVEKAFELFHAIESFLDSRSDRWKIDRDRQGYYNQFSSSGPGVLAISGTSLTDCSIGADPSAIVYLTYRDVVPWAGGGGGVCVSNIVPSDGRASLMTYEYNCILEKCVEEVLSPAVGPSAVWVQSPGTQTYSDVLSSQSARAFEAFVWSANRSSAASHPSDEGKWFDFLVSCARASETMGSEALKQILVQDFLWEASAALKLSEEFDFAIRLLRHANGR